MLECFQDFGRDGTKTRRATTRCKRFKLIADKTSCSSVGNKIIKTRPNRLKIKILNAFKSGQTRLWNQHAFKRRGTGTTACLTYTTSAVLRRSNRIKVLPSKTACLKRLQERILGTLWTGVGLIRHQTFKLEDSNIKVEHKNLSNLCQ